MYPQGTLTNAILRFFFFSRRAPIANQAFISGCFFLGRDSQSALLPAQNVLHSLFFFFLKNSVFQVQARVFLFFCQLGADILMTILRLLGEVFSFNNVQRYIKYNAWCPDVCHVTL